MLKPEVYIGMAYLFLALCYPLRQGFSLNPNLDVSARLFSQPSPWLHLSLTPGAEIAETSSSCRCQGSEVLQQGCYPLSCFRQPILRDIFICFCGAGV